ncbi:helix-turn-helix domain-containing protein [Paracoccus xiamenensis]|uniref:helix-turn-helix domain-containing protein n=1 Tax=Paracoccus xiamenensis TaxID=2714901 RepID=UPI00140A3465|nr:XRE family transcriptional regulator [Paracoccus xiamenensis]NHF72581.1 helix-turn-helix domain-containing protein [Paracoccus xiamenensis]
MTSKNSVVGGPNASFGARLKARRKHQKMTLTELAKLSDVSASTISKVENDAVSPTYEVIVKLARGLSTTISEMFGEPTLPAPVERAPRGWQVIGRHGEGVRLETETYDHLYLCSELVVKSMVPCIVRIKARTLSDFGPLTHHRGEEFIYVLKGKIELHTEFYASTVLNEGDFVYIDSTMGHAYLCGSDDDAVVLAVCAGGDPGAEAPEL